MVLFSQNKLADRKSGCFLVHCVHDANEKFCFVLSLPHR